MTNNLFDPNSFPSEIFEYLSLNIKNKFEQTISDKVYSVIWSYVSENVFKIQYQIIKPENFEKLIEEIVRNLERLQAKGEGINSDVNMEFLYNIFSNAMNNTSYDHLRSMFANLFSAAFDPEKIEIVHPNIISTINSLSPSDAILLYKFAKIEREERAIYAVSYTTKNLDNQNIHSNEDFYLVEDSDLDDEQTLVALASLINIGLIRIDEGNYSDDNFSSAKTETHFINRAPFYTGNSNKEVDIRKARIHFTPFGRIFRDIILK